jgi:uncharacterized protein YjiS (DUF1127 family)
MIQLLDRIGLHFRRWATYRRVRGELETYSERELNDMGLSRADITRVALEAASLVKPGPKQADGEGQPALLRQRYMPHP